MNQISLSLLETRQVMKTSGVKWWLPIIAFILLSNGCSNSVDTQVERSDDLYSMFGRLDVSKQENFIRIHDNRLPLLEVTEDELGIDVTLIDKSSGATELLTDRVIQYEQFYTHNFTSVTPLKYDRQYQLRLIDKNGFEDSIRVQTPREADVSLFVPQVGCRSLVFEVSFDPLDYSVGELLSFRIEFEHEGRIFGSSRDSGFSTDSGRVTVYFEVEDVINNGFKRGPFDRVTCHDSKINEYKLYYTYFGKELDPPGVVLENGDGSVVPLYGKRILGAYSDSMHITIDEALFDEDF